MRPRSNTSSDKVDENEDLMCSAFLFCWKSESVTLWVSEMELHNWMRWLRRRNLQPLERTYRPVSGCPLSGGHCSCWRPFPKGRGVGWSQIHVSISRMRWEHLSLPSVTFLWVRTGKLNMNSCCVIWWYQIISFWSSVYFYLGWGGGCLLQGFKNASNTFFFTNDW